MSRLRVLLIDPDPGSAAATLQLLRDSGIADAVHTATASAEAVARLRAGAVHMVLLDRSRPLPGEDAVWSALQQAAEPPPVVVLSGSGDDAQVLDAQQRGASQFIQKPLDEAAIMSIFSANGMFAFSASRRP